MADDREALGRLVHDTRLACEAERAAAEGRGKFSLGSWEERAPFQRELDMRIGRVVADYALTENAITWNTTCTSCARVLDSAYAETVRREAAEAKVAALEAALRRHTQFFTDSHDTELCGGCLEPAPCKDAALCGGEAVP